MTSVGKILIAAPSMPDPRFKNTLIMLVKCEEEGAFGVILNKTGLETMKSVWANVCKGQNWDVPYKGEAKYISIGGPVFGPLMLIHRNADASEITLAPGLHFTAKPSHLKEIAASSEQSRIFCGYAGWSANQLDAELKKGDWYVSDAQPELIFHDQHDDQKLWKKAMNQFGIQCYGMMGIKADFSCDPKMN